MKQKINKYTGLSDFEINCQVLATFEPNIKHMSLSHDEKSFYHCGVDGNGFYETTIPDYCNNPTDAMPIIIENKICTAFDVFAEEHDGGNWVASPAYGFANERTRSNNLYRAAMELFLLMKDAENEG